MKKILLSFYLLAGTIAANAQITYLTEDFEGGALPGGWSQTTLATDGGWKFGINTALQSTSFAIPAHTKMACTNDDLCNCNKSNDLLKTSAIDLSSAVNPYISFDCFYFQGTYSGASESAKLMSSTDGGVTWVEIQTITGAAGWNTKYISLSSLNGNSNVMLGFKYNDGNGWLFGWAIDNVSIFEPASNDAQLSAVTPSIGSGGAYGAVGGNVTIGGTIVNNGVNTITTVTVKYSDGTNVYTDVKTGLSVNSFESYQFTHATPFAVSSLGNHPLTVWVELSGDNNNSNDTLLTAIQGVAFLPLHKIVFEEGTGTWCGWCPRGAVFMDSMQIVHPTSTVLIAVHNQDPMMNTAYNAGLAISAFPTVKANRGTAIDPSDLFTFYDEHISDFGFADLTANCIYNPTTQIADITVDAHFATDLNTGIYRLAVVFTEDNLSGTTTAWDQHNYYSFQTNNLPLVGAGHNWQTETDPVPAAMMEYDHVALGIVPGISGQTGSLPGTIAGGATYTATFNYTVPSTSILANMHCFAVLIDVTHGQILNGNEGTITTGINEVSAGVTGASVYPNPVAENINLSLNLNNSQNIIVTVTDALGKVYSTLNAGKLSEGSHSLQMDARNLAQGVYFVNIKTDKGAITRKFTK